jgi:hypothetical protein
MGQKEHQLLTLLYSVEELLVELRDGGEDSDDYNRLSIIIKNLETHLQFKQDIL